MKREEFSVSNGEGWRIALVRTWDEVKLVPGRRPVLIVPGYGMNSFIFGFHPRGLSLEGYLVEAGFEVWRVDLRAQGESTNTGGTDRFGLGDLALTDLGLAIDSVREHTGTGADKVDVIGASLGGTLVFIHATVNRANHLGSIVAIGSPVRWVAIHPLVRFAFGSPRIAGLVRLKGTRALAERVLPHLVRFAPWVLSVYLNPSITDTSAVRELVRTVEDPNRHVNREIAHWFRDRDLVVRGVNVSEALREVRNPLLCVVANADGIVPRATAAFAYDHVGSPVRAVLDVGDASTAVAHADLFIATGSQELVFRPIADFFAAQYEPAAVTAIES